MYTIKNEGMGGFLLLSTLLFGVDPQDFNDLLVLMESPRSHWQADGGDAGVEPHISG